MRYLIAAIAVSLLIPLCYAVSGGAMPLFFSRSLFGVPFATHFVLLEMLALVWLCWYAMKVTDRDEPMDSSDRDHDDIRRGDK